MSDMTPGEVARVLGVDDRTLRRYADTYEAVHGPLPRVGAHRRFPAADVERLTAGVAVFRERPGVGLEAALRGGERLARPAASADLAALVAEVRALRAELQEVRVMVAALGSGAEVVNQVQEQVIEEIKAPIASHAVKVDVSTLLKSEVVALEAIDAGAVLQRAGPGWMLVKGGERITSVTSRTLARMVEKGVLVAPPA